MIAIVTVRQLPSGYLAQKSLLHLVWLNLRPLYMPLFHIVLQCREHGYHNWRNEDVDVRT
jgi:hypothetical protein